MRVTVDREHGVAAVLQHRPEEPSDEAVADDERPPAGNSLRAPENACERLDVRSPGVVDRARQFDPARGADTLGEAARDDRRLREPFTRRLVPGDAAAAAAAPGVVDQCDATAVDGLGDDLVPEHRARGGAADLLDVRAAEPAREDANELPRPLGSSTSASCGSPSGPRTTARTGVS